jgi:argininosuccinate lyase
VRDFVSLTNSVRMRNVRGGTGPRRVKSRLEALKKT